MTTFLWIITIHLLTVAITYKPILSLLRTKSKLHEPFTPEFMAAVNSSVPILNLFLVYQAWRYWRGLKNATKNGELINQLRKRFESHPDEEVRDVVMKAADFLEEMKKEAENELKKKEQEDQKQ